MIDGVIELLDKAAPGLLADRKERQHHIESMFGNIVFIQMAGHAAALKPLEILYRLA